MKDKKHIDRLFQEKLKDFEASPSDSIWATIENRLHQDKRKRRAIPIWWQIAGVAAVLTLLLTVGNFIINDSSNIKTTNTIVNTDETANPTGEDSVPNINLIESGNVNKNVENDLNSDSNNNLNQKQNNTTITKSNYNSVKNKNDIKPHTLIKNPSNIANKSVANITDSKSNDVNNTSNLPEPDRNNSDDNKPKSVTDPMFDTIKSDVNTSVTDTQAKEDAIDLNEEKTESTSNPIEEAIANSNTIDEKEKEEKLNRWNISTNVAPVYFSSFGNGSSLDEQFIGNSKSGELNMSYGINGSYAVSEKLKIRAGINKVNLGYNTNNVIVYRGVGITLVGALSRSNSNIKFNDDSQNTTILSTQNLSFATVPDVVNTSVNSSLNQELGFIELPVELEYAILNNKFGVNVIGGFSTFFLDKNKISTTLNGDKSLLGKAKNINDTSYSANFGLGLNYNVSEKIKFNFEPTFKYQINTFTNTSGDFNPFFIGFYTGLSYKF